MDPKLQTSFIPKKTLGETKRVSTPIGFFTLIGWVVFFITIGMLGAVYLWSFLLNRAIAQDQTSLASKNIDLDTANNLIKMNDRLLNVSDLLQKHLAVSNLFEALASSTLQSVQFVSLIYTVVDAHTVTINLTGKAPNFAAVALQSDTFAQQSFLKNVTFSDLALNPDNSVNFKVDASVDPSFLKYQGQTSLGTSTQVNQ